MVADKGMLFKFYGYFGLNRIIAACEKHGVQLTDIKRSWYGQFIASCRANRETIDKIVAEGGINAPNHYHEFVYKTVEVVGMNLHRQDTGKYRVCSTCLLAQEYVDWVTYFDSFADWVDIGIANPSEVAAMV